MLSGIGRCFSGRGGRLPAVKGLSPTPPHKGEGLNLPRSWHSILTGEQASRFLPPCGGDAGRQRGTSSRHTAHAAGRATAASGSSGRSSVMSLRQ